MIWILVKYSPKKNHAKKDAETGSLIRVNDAKPVLTFPNAQVINPMPKNWLMNAKQKIVTHPFKEIGINISFEKIIIMNKVMALNNVPNKNIIYMLRLLSLKMPVDIK